MMNNELTELNNKRIWFVEQFPTYNIDIDFERPDLAQTEISKMVDRIETNSGIANVFGKPDNIGEGIVFYLEDLQGNLLRFKAKGEAHSASKVKTLKPVDNEKEQVKIDFANYATPAWRLEQMYNLANNTINGGQPDVKNIGKFIKMVNQDIIKEEIDVMAERGLEPKDVMGKVNEIAKRWFYTELNASVKLN